LGAEERYIDEELPFDLPDSWEWCRLDNLVRKEIKRGKSPQYDDKGRVLVFAQKCNTKAGVIDLSLAKHLSDTAFHHYPTEEWMLDKDIVVNSTGHGTLGRIGFFQDSDRNGDELIVPDSHVTIVRTTRSVIPEYILSVLKYYQPFLEEQGSGSTNQTELRPDSISSLLIPIPPINEQKRIVDCIEKGFEITNQLSYQ